MYCPKKLQLNKFVAVKCPKPKDLFQRIGQRMPNIDNMSNDGTSYDNPVDFNLSGIQQLEKIANQEKINLYNEYAEAKRKEAVSNNVESSEE